MLVAGSVEIKGSYQDLPSYFEAFVCPRLARSVLWQWDWFDTTVSCEIYTLVYQLHREFPFYMYIYEVSAYYTCIDIMSYKYAKVYVVLFMYIAFPRSICAYVS